MWNEKNAIQYKTQIEAKTKYSMGQINANDCILGEKWSKIS